MKRETLTAAFAILWLVAAAAHALDETPAVKVTALVKSTTSWNGKRVAYPQGEAEISGMVIEIAPGAQTGWHAHPVPSFAMVLQGTLEVTLEDGRQKGIGAGEALIEVVNTLHNGRNVGTGPLKIVVFYAGAVGQPLTVKP